MQNKCVSEGAHYLMSLWLFSLVKSIPQFQAVSSLMPAKISKVSFSLSADIKVGSIYQSFNQSMNVHVLASLASTTIQMHL